MTVNESLFFFFDSTIFLIERRLDRQQELCTVNHFAELRLNFTTLNSAEVDFNLHDVRPLPLYDLTHKWCECSNNSSPASIFCQCRPVANSCRVYLSQLVVQTL